MDTFFRLQLPSEFQARTETLHELPPGCRYPVRYAKVEWRRIENTSLLRQWLHSYHSYMELAMHTVEDKLNADIVVEKPAIIFCYAFKGNIQGISNQGVPSVYLYQGQYNACYCPSGRYRISFPGGHYMFFTFVPETNYFRRLTQEYRELESLLQHLSDRSSLPHALQPCAIRFPIKRLIGSLRINDRKSNELESLLGAFMVKLVKVYDRQLRELRLSPQAILKAAENYIKARIQEGQPPSVEEVAATFRLTSRTLLTYCREYYNITPQELILAGKMEEALHLLSQPGQTILAISDKLGYSSQSSFSKAFRRYYGNAPGQVKSAITQTPRPGEPE